MKNIRPYIFDVLSALLHPSVFFGAKNYLFVISHMRSRSSLLCHLLGGNPEITGYSEMAQSYQNQLSLYLLRVKLYVANDRNVEGRYLLDKILHNRYRIAEAYLDDERIRYLFLIREPEATFRSVVTFESSLEKQSPDDAFGRVLRYYVGRLKEIESVANRVGGRSLWLNSDVLVTNSDLVLRALQKYLDLTTPVAPEYPIFRFTGRRGHGDPSCRIKARKILPAKEDQKAISIPQDVLTQAMEAYSSCVNVLSRRCLGVNALSD